MKKPAMWSQRRPSVKSRTNVILGIPLPPPGLPSEEGVAFGVPLTGSERARWSRSLKDTRAGSRYFEVTYLSAAAKFAGRSHLSTPAMGRAFDRKICVPPRACLAGLAMATPANSFRIKNGFTCYGGAGDRHCHASLPRASPISLPKIEYSWGLLTRPMSWHPTSLLQPIG